MQGYNVVNLPSATKPNVQGPNVPIPFPQQILQMVMSIAKC